MENEKFLICGKIARGSNGKSSFFNFLCERFVSIPEDATQPRFLLKYDCFCLTGPNNFQLRQVSEAQRKSWWREMCKENARKIRERSHKYQDRLRIFAGRKAIQQANDRRIHHSSDWCQLHLIILGGLKPHDGGMVWVGEPRSRMCPIGDVSREKSME